MTTTEKTEKTTKRARSKSEEAAPAATFPYEFLEAKVTSDEVDPTDLIFAPFDSRANSDKVELDESFVKDIQANGILQAPLVTLVRDVATGKTGYMLVAGRQRVRAAIQLKMKTIQVTVRTMTLLDALVACGSENMKRKRLSFFDEATYMRMLVEEHNLTRTNLAQRLDISNAKVTQYLAVFELDERVQKMVRKGNFGDQVATKVREIKNFTDGDVQYAVALKAVEKGWTSDDIKEAYARFEAKEAEREKARKEKEKAKASAKKAAKGGAEEEEESEEEEAPASKFDASKISVIKPNYIHSLLDMVQARIDKIRSVEDEKDIDVEKLAFERGKLEGLKLAGGLKALPKSLEE